MKIWLTAAAALAMTGCGYIGEPLPPLLNIPARIEDLTAVERGDKIVAQFTAPRLTTEGVVMRTPPRLELLAGEGGDPFDSDRWAAQATRTPAGVVQDGRARFEFPVAAWIGREIVLGAHAVGANGRDSGWSNLVVLRVVPPPAPPTAIRAESVPEGMQVTWKGASDRFRVYRRGEGEELAAVATVERPEWVDTGVENGKAYTYVLQALMKAGQGEAESELSTPTGVLAEDRRPPAAPTGLTVAVSPGAVQLVWDRNTEPDLAGYRVYRTGVRISVMETVPLYQDRGAESGKTYSYAVSAVDKSGNESAPSQPVEVTVPAP